MPLDLSSLFICDNPGCPGDGVHTPAQVAVSGEGLPDGWIQFTGTSTVGPTFASGTSYFHSISCCSAWFGAVIVPYLTAIGGTVNGP